MHELSVEDSMCNVEKLLCSLTGFCLLFGSMGGCTQEDQFEVKGAKLGISQQEFMKKLPFLKCDNPKRTALSDVECSGYSEDACPDRLPSAPPRPTTLSA